LREFCYITKPSLGDITSHEAPTIPQIEDILIILPFFSGKIYRNALCVQLIVESTSSLLDDVVER